MDSEMVPIILCGGAGVRLWPLSTPSHPKPFHAFFGGETLFQKALRRGTGTPFTLRPIVVASERHAELALAQAHGIGIAVDLLLEQEAKDSCAAALSGALAAQSRHGNCLAAILAADQEIPDAEGVRTGLAGLGLPLAPRRCTTGRRRALSKPRTRRNLATVDRGGQGGRGEPHGAALHCLGLLAGRLHRGGARSLRSAER